MNDHNIGLYNIYFGLKTNEGMTEMGAQRDGKEALPETAFIWWIDRATIHGYTQENIQNKSSYYTYLVIPYQHLMILIVYYFNTFMNVI